MRISVVVPTYKRAESLARCLDALVAQHTPAEEILVVVREEDLAGQAVVRSFQTPVGLVLVGRAGVIAAMNAGVEISTGEIVALTDDDAAPRPDWLTRIAAAYASDTRIAAVGGRDWVYATAGLIEGVARTVGTVKLFGHVTRNHHLVVGPPGYVDVLEGVNLSVRGEMMRRLWLRLAHDRRRHRATVGVVAVSRAAAARLRVVYELSIAVDLHPQPRSMTSRRFSRASRRLHTQRGARDPRVHARVAAGDGLTWALAVGTSPKTGLAQLLRAIAQLTLHCAQFIGAQSGLQLGLRTDLRPRRRERRG